MGDNPYYYYDTSGVALNAGQPWQGQQLYSSSQYAVQAPLPPGPPPPPSCPPAPPPPPARPSAAAVSLTLPTVAPLPPDDSYVAPPPLPAAADAGGVEEEYDIFAQEADENIKAEQLATKQAAQHALFLAAEQQKISNLEREKEEHARRVDAENRKKRKLQTQRSSFASHAALKRPNTGTGTAFSVFGDDDNDYDAVADASESCKDISKGEGSKPDLQPEILDLIVKTATWAVNNPDKYDVLLQNSKNNPKLFFLADKLCPAGVRYTEEFRRLRAQQEVQSVCNESPVLSIQSAQIRAALQAAENITAISQSSSGSGKVSFSADTSEGLPKTTARKNRWGPPACHPDVPSACLVQMPIVDSQFAKQIREQKELQLLESRIKEAVRRQAGVAAAMVGDGADQLQLERLKEYEALAALDDPHARRDTVSDAELNQGVVEGGSWEHRKRAKEMKATAQKNFELTLLASEKHHIADFLPADELNKFIKKATAVAKGEALPVESDYAKHKLERDNVGFQLLQRAGWTEGSGLGSSNNNASASTSMSTDKLIEPVNIPSSANRGNVNTGIGVVASQEVSEGDDEFDSYRKRMMLAYRFRPNPLNNPRRDYY